MSAVKFPVGQTVATVGVTEWLREGDPLLPIFITECIQRHQSGDWGDVDDHDRKANDAALVEGTRLLSVYHAGSDLDRSTIWIITEWDRSVTTILFPDEY